MVSKSDEYNSLRQELRDYQNSRNTILSLALTVISALFGIGVQLSNPLLPLFALLILFLARIQITQTHSSIQRIAAYIRIMIEQDNAELNWETGSYQIRRASIGYSAEKINKTQNIAHNSLLLPIDHFLLACSLVAIMLAVLITWFSLQSASPTQSRLGWSPVAYFIVISATTIVWGTLWIWNYRKIRELEGMEVDNRETTFWKEFKQTVMTIKANE